MIHMCGIYIYFIHMYIWHMCVYICIFTIYICVFILCKHLLYLEELFKCICPTDELSWGSKERCFSMLNPPTVLHHSLYNYFPIPLIINMCILVLLWLIAYGQKAEAQAYLSFHPLSLSPTLLFSPLLFCLKICTGDTKQRIQDYMLSDAFYHLVY